MQCFGPTIRSRKRRKPTQPKSRSANTAGTTSAGRAKTTRRRQASSRSFWLVPLWISAWEVAYRTQRDLLLGEAEAVEALFLVEVF